jgi:hypothetical protein
VGGQSLFFLGSIQHVEWASSTKYTWVKSVSSLPSAEKRLCENMFASSRPPVLSLSQKEHATKMDSEMPSELIQRGPG